MYLQHILLKIRMKNYFSSIMSIVFTSFKHPKLQISIKIRERSGSVVECLTRDRRVAGSSLTGVTALWSLSKTHLS